jgi:hypothetical protein
MGNLLRVSAFVIVAMVLGSAAAQAQSAGPDEAIAPGGNVMQSLVLTPAQKSAIYNAVFERRVKPSAVLLSSAIGATVPQSVELIDLPDTAAGDNPWAADLKYATVDDDVVVVDPVRMRVVYVIHDSAKP